MDDAPVDSPDWRDVLRAAGNEPSRPTTLPKPDAPASPPSQPSSLPPGPDDLDDAEAPEDAVAGPPAYVIRPTPHAMPRVPSTPPPAGDPPSGIVVGTASRELFGGPLGAVTTLDDLADIIAKCTRCPLYRTATKPVPGQGSPTAELVCVGEAPGENEDKIGPRVRRARQGNFSRRFSPPLTCGERTCSSATCSSIDRPGIAIRCRRRSKRAVRIWSGSSRSFARRSSSRSAHSPRRRCSKRKLSIGKLRGSVHRYYGIPLVVTYHPAALLRNPAWKRPTWEDVQLARRVLDRAPGA